jgi:glycerol kinase
MPHHDLVLGLHVETTDIKCLALDGAGTIVVQASQPTPQSHPRPGWTDFEPGPLWERDVDGFRAFMERYEEGLAIEGSLCKRSNRSLVLPN